MTASMPHDFDIEGVACRWQADVADALSVAHQWLHQVTACLEPIGRDAHGRPRLASGTGDIGWSHTRGRLLLAHAPRGVIGVDVEHAARRVDALRIATRYFSADEIAGLQALEGPPRTSAFLHLWCAKEAVLKAHGRGLAFGLARVSFRLDAGGLHMTACDPELGAPGEWLVHAWEPEQGYLAVLAWRDGILAR